MFMEKVFAKVMKSIAGNVEPVLHDSSAKDIEHARESLVSIPDLPEWCESL